MFGNIIFGLTPFATFRSEQQGAPFWSDQCAPDPAWADAQVDPSDWEDKSLSVAEWGDAPVEAAGWSDKEQAVSEWDKQSVTYVANRRCKNAT